MSTSTDAIIAYGYDLGNTDAGWKIQGVEQWETWLPSWLSQALKNTPPAEHDDLVDDDGQFDDHGLVTLIGERLDLHGLKDVHIVNYGATSTPAYILASWSAEAARGEALVLPRQLPTGNQENAGYHRRQLAGALRVLDLQPTQDRPEFLLAPYAEM